MPWKTYDQMMSAFKSLNHPLYSWEKIGTSVQGREIIAAKIGPSWGGKIYISCCCHGGEQVNGEIAWLYANWLLQEKEAIATQILHHNQTIIVPILNPDGYVVGTANGWGRKNAHGVDLNRNAEFGWGGGSSVPTDYDYRGTGPLSEPESKAYHELFIREKPRWVLNMHTGATPIYKETGDTAYKNHITSSLNRYKELCTQRGLDPNAYPITQLSGYIGREMDDGYKLANAYGLIWEFHPVEVNVRDNNPIFDDIEPLWFPKFLPMAIALSEDCSVETPPPSPSIMPVIPLFVIGAVYLVYRLQNR